MSLVLMYGPGNPPRPTPVSAPLPELGDGDEYEARPDPERFYDLAADAKIIDWRILCLMEAGFDQMAANTLAVLRKVDLHEAVRMIADGCTPETALLILL